MGGIASQHREETEVEGYDSGWKRDVLEALLYDQALRTQAHGKDHPPLVVEVAEDHRHSLALLTECVR
jgi:hypothetical protein